MTNRHDIAPLSEQDRLKDGMLKTTENSYIDLGDYKHHMKGNTYYFDDEQDRLDQGLLKPCRQKGPSCPNADKDNFFIGAVFCNDLICNFLKLLDNLFSVEDHACFHDNTPQTMKKIIKAITAFWTCQ